MGLRTVFPEQIRVGIIFWTLRLVSSDRITTVTKLSFDALAVSFDDQRGLPVAALSALIDLIDELASGRTLDVIEPGIGTGRIALAALARGDRVAGVDSSRPMLDALRTRLDIHPELRERTMVARADARHLPFPAATFDLAILASVLYLIPEWPIALEEAIRVLRPDAALVAVIERSTPSSALGRWDALWRERIERSGYRHPVMQPDEDALVVALGERCSSVEVRALATWTIGQTVGEARRSLGTLRALYSSVSDREWDDAIREFDVEAVHAFPDPGIRLDCEVLLEVAICRGFGSVI